MDYRERNTIVRAIEVAYRNGNNPYRADQWEVRLRQINPDTIRKIMREEKIGVQCEKCLNKGSGRYCSNEHSIYYRDITNQLYGTQYPYGYYQTDIPNLREKQIEPYIEGGHAVEATKITCPVCGKIDYWTSMSVDHIISIASGGLEFDRDNLQWMCLSCNCKKSGGKRAELVLKKKIYNSKQTLLFQKEIGEPL
jgi:5-methylcytosine-specific restriction endonuclease McrA